ncbi:tautomerase family protein [Streptomyces sp. MMG1121]|uniref:tautomerase family protein n=1 Tax=Streptomyces sp. MMG1121 TaxID=1415544 RepID=UPI0006AEDB1F|nr:tautomerase family protein [Streptomyces sp. MMG1121]KOV64140.1 tautomerase [Streptomyces sp. MMG1121]
MPFVRIDALGTDPGRLDALGQAVQDALVETLGVPPDDRFQVLTGHDGARSTLRHDDYLGVHRDDAVVFVAITMRAGRTPDRKRAVYRRIAELVHERTGTDPGNVFVTVTENAPVDWSFGHGVAQYAPGGEEPAGASS